MNVYIKSFTRELKIICRNKYSMIIPLFFFIISVSLFPLAIGADAKFLTKAAPGIIWVVVMLAILLSINLIFQNDFDNGVLEQLIISTHFLELHVLAKISAYWLLNTLPIILLSPLLGVFLFLDKDSILVLVTTLLLATPSLSLIGAIGAALTVGIKNSNMLLALIILPLYTPILIFASSAVINAQFQLSIAAQLYFLATILMVSLIMAPFVIAFALKVNFE